MNNLSEQVLRAEIDRERIQEVRRIQKLIREAEPTIISKCKYLLPCGYCELKNKECSHL